MIFDEPILSVYSQTQFMLSAVSPQKLSQRPFISSITLTFYITSGKFHKENCRLLSSRSCESHNATSVWNELRREWLLREVRQERRI